MQVKIQVVGASYSLVLPTWVLRPTLQIFKNGMLYLIVTKLSIVYATMALADFLTSSDLGLV